MDIPRKVLVVDDERGIRLLLSDALSSEGFEVRIAKDGQESLDLLDEYVFDLVITDINMPRLDGIAMLKSMKKSGRKEKVIIMTGNPVDQDLLDREIPGVLMQFQKPFRMDHFLNVVSTAVANT